MNRQHRRQLSGRGKDPESTVPDDAEMQVGDHLASEAAAEEADGAGSERVAKAALAPSRHRTGPRQFLHEVNGELRKVAWPTRAETLNYSIVVLITLSILMALIFGLDLAFTKVAGFLFNP